jgi:hypothetical protein
LLIGVASAPQAATTGFRLPYTIPDSATAALGVLLAVAVLATAEAPGAKDDSPEGLTSCTGTPRIGLPQSDVPDREGTDGQQRSRPHQGQVTRTIARFPSEAGCP